MMILNFKTLWRVLKEYGALLGKEYSDRGFLLRIINALLFLAIALVVNFFASRVATFNAGPSVPDLLLSTLPAIDTHFIDSYLTLYLQVGVFLLAFLLPRKLVFFINTASLLIIVRALFINLTYLGLPLGANPTVSFFTRGGDLFFSGHTALPFLAALVYWEIRSARYVLLLLSFFMGLQVLVGHHHYSIDVFSAPFITYGVFILCKKYFFSTENTTL